MTVEIQLRDLDRRVTHLEATMNNIESSMHKIETLLDKNTDGQQKLEIKMAYSAGGFAIAVIIAQIGLQVLIQTIFHTT